MPLHFGVGLLPKYPAAQFVELVRSCEAWGYDHIWIPDERFYRECYCYLTLAAVNTHRVRLGTAVTDPYSRHPAMTAAALATVDEISGGRVVLGMGAGVSGFAEMGIDRVKPAKAIRDALAIVRGLIAGERTTVNGEVISVKGAKLDFEPLRSQIPLYVAGAAPLVLKTAGALADGVILGDLAGPDVVRWGLARVESGTRAAGRELKDLYKVVWLQTFIHPDGQVARDHARWMVAFVLWGTQKWHAEMGITLPEELARNLDFGYHLSPESVGDRAKLVSDDLVRRFALAGSPEEVTQQVAELAAAGVDQVAIHPWSFADMTSERAIELFAREVIPKAR